MKNRAIKTSLAIFALALLIITVSAVFAVSAPLSVANADSAVSVIKAPVANLEGNPSAGKSTLKLIQPNGSKAVYVPESYFVEYTHGDKKPLGGKMYEVSYAGKTFYVEGEPSVSSVTVGDDELLFPNVQLTVKDGETLSVLNGILDVTNDYTIKFLGYGEDGTELFVSVANEDSSPIYDFIPAEKVNAFTVPYQHKTQVERDELLASKVEPPIFDGGNITPKTSVALRIIIIIGIAIPAVLIAILLFKPSKNERRYSKNSVRSDRARDDFDYDDSRSYRRRDDRDDRYRDDDRRVAPPRDYDRRYDRDYDYDYRDRDRDRRYDRD